MDVRSVPVRSNAEASSSPPGSHRDPRSPPNRHTRGRPISKGRRIESSTPATARSRSGASTGWCRDRSWRRSTSRWSPTGCH